MNEENSIPNIWKAQENMIRFYKLLSIGLGGVALLLVVFVMLAFFRDPIVVVKNGAAQEFYPSKRAKAEIQKADVEAFTKRFLNALYAWPEFSGEKLAREIAPLAEEALVRKIMDAQAQKYGNQFKGKKLSQAITFVSVDVQDDRVLCRFDRVLKIEGIPLVIPTEVSLAMLQGNQTDMNPMGIYVSGITERDGAK